MTQPNPSMKVVEISRFGAPEVLQLAERPRPEAGAAEVLIQVSASGVNRPDVLQRLGKYPAPVGVSDIPGLEIAGRIVAGDAKAMADAGFKLGDSVCALVAGGGYAEYCVAPVAQCLPLPAGLSELEAAALPENYFTVYSNVIDRGRLQAQDWILIQGGSSGIGVTAIQLAKAYGAKVIATAGSDDKCQACIDLGADYAINYKTHDFAAEVLRITEKRGVDVVLDMVAGDYVAREISCTAEDGRIVVIATQGGTEATIDIGLLYRKRITLTGSTLRVRPTQFKAAIAQNLLKNVWPLLAGQKMKPVVFQSFAAADAAKAHALMESNQHIGKIMLLWS